MPYQRVEQIHHNGCFVAATAVLLGKSYEDTLRLMCPGQTMQDYSHGFPSTVGAEAKLAYDTLTRLGIKLRPARERRIRCLRKNALLLIRWKRSPTLLHFVVYLAKEKKFLDSWFEDSLRLEVYQRQLDAVFLIDQPPPENPAPNYIPDNHKGYTRQYYDE